MSLSFPAPRWNLNINDWPSVIRTSITIAAFVILAMLILLTPVAGTSQTVNLELGDVAPVDIVAPYSGSYVSELRTEESREAAAAAVSAVYDPPDTQITRQQITRAQATLNFIGSVRADSYADPSQKINDISELTHANIGVADIVATLDLSETRWALVQTEVLRLIESVMSGVVREDRLEQAQERIPLLVRVAFNEEEAHLISTLATEFVAPNSLFNEGVTESTRQAAKDAIEPVTLNYANGQTIVSRGRVIDSQDIEALQAFDLLQDNQAWWQTALPALLACLLFISVLGAFMARYEPTAIYNMRTLLFVGLLVLVFLFIGRAMLIRTVLPYIFPAATLSMLISIGIRPSIGIASAVTFAIFTGFITNGAFDVTIFHMFGSIIAVLALRRATKTTSYLRAGLTVSLINIVVILIFQFNDPTLNVNGLFTLAGAGFANGLISASLSLMGVYLLARPFSITTALQLHELSRPSHPLLQELRIKAPGTYQHSLQIANLAEQAAQIIGADDLLVHVGALYHDIGKSIKPEFYVENQLEGINPHDVISAKDSAAIIIDHVRDGATLARDYRMPDPIVQAILEHHGTSRTMYQYSNALKEADGDASQLDMRDFTYPGPKPQSRETALLMLADGCEAKARADRPTSIEEIEEIVDIIFNARIRDGQLDECPITQNELRLVRNSYINTLKGFFHSRLKYPSLAALDDASKKIETGPLKELAAPDKA